MVEYVHGVRGERISQMIKLSEYEERDFQRVCEVMKSYMTTDEWNLFIKDEASVNKVRATILKKSKSGMRVGGWIMAVVFGLPALGLGIAGMLHPGFFILAVPSALIALVGLIAATAKEFK